MISPPPNGYQPIPNYTGTNAGLQFRNAINDRFSGLSPIAPKIARLNFAQLPAEQDGFLAYCADCQQTTPCANGGSGGWAFGAQGQWQCSAPDEDLAGDVNGVAYANQVTATHLSSPLPLAQGGSGNTQGAPTMMQNVGAGGWNSSTTNTTISISSGSASATLASATGFKRGDYVLIRHGGAASTLSAPAGITLSLLTDATAISSESIGTGDGTTTCFTHSMAHGHIKVGSIQVTAGAVVSNYDNMVSGNNPSATGTLSGTGIQSGWIPSTVAEHDESHPMSIPGNASAAGYRIYACADTTNSSLANCTPTLVASNANIWYTNPSFAACAGWVSRQAGEIDVGGNVNFGQNAVEVSTWPSANVTKRITISHVYDEQAAILFMFWGSNNSSPDVIENSFLQPSGPNAPAPMTSLPTVPAGGEIGLSQVMTMTLARDFFSNNNAVSLAQVWSQYGIDSAGNNWRTTANPYVPTSGAGGGIDSFADTIEVNGTAGTYGALRALWAPAQTNLNAIVAPLIAGYSAAKMSDPLAPVLTQVGSGANTCTYQIQYVDVAGHVSNVSSTASVSCPAIGSFSASNYVKVALSNSQITPAALDHVVVLTSSTRGADTPHTIGSFPCPGQPSAPGNCFFTTSVRPRRAIPG